MAGKETASATTTQAAEPDPFAAAFAGLSSMKDGDAVPANLDFTKPVETKPAETAAKTETAAETTGANAPVPTDTEITPVEGVEERPVAPTHKENGDAFTADEITAAQAVLDKEFEDGKAAGAAAQKIVDDAAAAKAKSDDDAVTRLADTLNKRLAPTPTTTTEAPKDTGPKPFAFTTEEQEIITAYERDFPDAIRAEALLRKREYHNMLTYVFAQMNQRMVPAEQMLAALANRTHHDDLTKGIDGYSDELIDKVEGWIEKQPSFLKTAYTAAMTEGTAADVKEVIARYRVETGTPAAQKTAATAKAPDPKTVEAAKALAPVATKRSQTATTGIAKDDFDNAFTEFAKEPA